MNNTTYSDEFIQDKWLEIAEAVVQIQCSWKYKLYVGSLLLIFVAAVIGNILTCIVIHCDKSMHTTTNYYLYNLAVSDLLGSFGILLEVRGQFAQPMRCVHSELAASMMCKMQLLALLCLWNSSVLTMTMLAVERYLAICYPITTRSKPRRMRKVITFIWLAAILESLPEIFMLNLTNERNICLCYTVPNRLSRTVSGVLAILTFILPLTVMICVYTLIGLKINVSQKHKTWGNTFNRQDSRRKVNKLIIAITISFVICWLPYFVLRASLFATDISQIAQYKQFWCVVYYVTAFGWFSAVLNPLLFSVISSKFRKALKALWDKKIKRRQSKIYRVSPTSVKEEDML